MKGNEGRKSYDVEVAYWLWSSISIAAMTIAATKVVTRVIEHRPFLFLSLYCFFVSNRGVCTKAFMEFLFEDNPMAFVTLGISINESPFDYHVLFLLTME